MGQCPNFLQPQENTEVQVQVHLNDKNQALQETKYQLSLDDPLETLFQPLTLLKILKKNLVNPKGKT